MEYQKPILDIQGDKYRVEFDTNKLVFTVDESKILSFSQMELNSYTCIQRFLYDHQSKSIYQLQKGESALPRSVSYVEIPTSGLLDSVALARSIGCKDKEINLEFFERNKKEHYARVMPEVSLNGDKFFIDCRREAFVDSLNLLNLIHFEDIQQRDNGMLFFLYEPSQRNLIKPQWENYFRNSKVLIELPPYTEIDPYGSQLIQLKNESFHIPDLVYRRLIGMENVGRLTGQLTPLKNRPRKNMHDAPPGKRPGLRQ